MIKRFLQIILSACGIWIICLFILYLLFKSRGITPYSSLSILFAAGLVSYLIDRIGGNEK